MAMDAAAAAEEASEREAARTAAVDLKAPGALTIAILAMLLAVTTLGGDDAGARAVEANIHASDTFNFYQAKNIRQTDYQLAADELETLMPLLPPDAARLAREKMERYRATAARYESEPDPAAPDDPTKGDGKKELLARAQNWEAIRDRASAQGPNFDYGNALFQIGIVLASVAIVSSVRAILMLSWIAGIVAAFLMANGYLLVFELPIG